MRDLVGREVHWPKPVDFVEEQWQASIRQPRIWLWFTGPDGQQRYLEGYAAFRSGWQAREFVDRRIATADRRTKSAKPNDPSRRGIQRRAQDRLAFLESRVESLLACIRRTATDPTRSR